MNIGGKVKHFTTTKSRGRGTSKRTWEIEDNTFRQRCLATYWTVDRLDHLVKQLNLFYVSWKHWHSPMRHWMAIAAVTACSMCQECADGELNPAWKLPKPKQLSFWAFNDSLASGLLAYNPTGHKCPGDSKMRASTAQHKRRRSGSGGAAAASQSVGGVTIMNKTKILARSESGRLLGQFDKIYSHFDAVELGLHHPRSCAVCGDPVYSERAHPDCVSNGKGTPLHYFGRKGKFQLRQCFVQCHDTTFCGLARCDAVSMGKKKADFKRPGKKQRLDCAAAVKSSLCPGESDENPIAPAATAAAAAAVPTPVQAPAPAPPAVCPARSNDVNIFNSNFAVVLVGGARALRDCPVSACLQGLFPIF